MKKRILIGALMLFSFTVFGQTAPDEIIKSFFNNYEKDPNRAIDDLYATNPWSTRIKDGIENIKKEVNGYTIDYVGKYYGYELITKKQFSESFVLYSYMIRYDRQPMRFIFILYKPDINWTLYSFTIDSDLDDEIQQAAKLYYLNLDKNK